MAKVWFDFSAATNGNGNSPLTPRNTLAGYTFLASDEHFFRRGTTYAGGITLVAGTAGRKTKYSSWYNSDGTDDMSRPRCTFTLTGTLNTYNTARDNVTVDSLKFVLAAGAVANDSNVIFLGNNSALWNCEIDSNVGCVGAYGKSNVLIAYNSLAGVSHANTNANNVICSSDSRIYDNLQIIGNTIVFKGGGNASSNAIRSGSDSASFPCTNLLIADNTISPPAGTAKTPNQYSHGIRLQCAPNAEIRHNNIKGMLAGIFMTGGGMKWGAWIHHNVLCDNWNFGLHCVTDIDGCLVEYNDCSRNGTDQENAVMHAYGRGIEFSGAAGQYRCGNSVFRFNVMNDNINYGGPQDNGSEGCGLGYDDGTWGCVAYGNVFIGNEGNGIQYYGGPLGTGWTDTSNHAVANFFQNNCKASIKNRRTGGTTKTAFCAHIGMAATIGGQSIVANNVFVGGDCGISQTSNCANVYTANNIFIDVPNAMSFGHATGYGCFNNVFHSKTITVKKYSTTATDANGTPTYPTLAYNGTNDYTFDPLLDANYRPLGNSPCIAAGNAIATLFVDKMGRKFKSLPSIGMFENSAADALPAIRH